MFETMLRSGVPPHMGQSPEPGSEATACLHTPPTTHSRSATESTETAGTREPEARMLMTSASFLHQQRSWLLNRRVSTYSFGLSMKLSKEAPNWASMNSPGAPCLFPLGSTRSISQFAGSVSPTGHAFPWALTLPSGKFSTRSLRRYQASGFQENGTVTVRVVSGSHGSSFNFWELPYSTSE